MINYCDFEEQTTVETDEGDRLRPDMLIHLPNERQVVVDSKVPLAAYLDALDEADRRGQTDAVAAPCASHPRPYQRPVAEEVLEPVRQRSGVRGAVYSQ